MPNNLGYATGHPSFIMSNSLANQTLAQIERLNNRGEYEKKVYIPGLWFALGLLAGGSNRAFPITESSLRPPSNSSPSRRLHP